MLVWTWAALLVGVGGAPGALRRRSARGFGATPPKCSDVKKGGVTKGAIPPEDSATPTPTRWWERGS